jgi:glucokinase
LQLVAGDAQGNVLDRRRYCVDRSRGRAGIQQQIEQALPELMRRWNPRGLGVGFGGPVDWRNGRICCSHHVEGWSEFALGAWLARLTDLPVHVDNDANVAALGEATHGAGAGCNPVFYVTLGSGVGGGLVVDGRIYHGATPGESEIGHVRLDRSGTLVEDRCSGWAVDRRIRALRTAGTKSRLCDWIGETPGGEAKHLGRALGEGDRMAREILDETAEHLAFALSHATHLFHPAVIVLGGGLSLVGEPLRGAVAGALPRFLMSAFAPGPAVKLAGCGEDAVPVGCLVLARTM